MLTLKCPASNAVSAVSLCFGITGEVNKKISDVTFRDCAVIYRDGIWDNNRIGSLVVVAEQTEGSIDGILFDPQIAVMSDAEFLIEKEENDGKKSAKLAFFRSRPVFKRAKNDYN